MIVFAYLGAFLGVIARLFGYGRKPRRQIAYGRGHGRRARRRGAQRVWMHKAKRAVNDRRRGLRK